MLRYVRQPLLRILQTCYAMRRPHVFLLFQGALTGRPKELLR